MDVSLELSIWGLSILLMVTTVIPVKFAAEFVGAKRTTLPYCGLAVALATLLIIGAFNIIGDKLETYLLSFLLVLLSYKYVLGPPPGHSLWLAVIAFAVQLGVMSAFISYGSYSGAYSFSF
jgi:hypothetical protein